MFKVLDQEYQVRVGES